MELRSIAGRVVETRVKEHPKKRGSTTRELGQGVGEIGWEGGLGGGMLWKPSGGRYKSLGSASNIVTAKIISQLCQVQETSARAHILFGLPQNNS